jgi:uncharacterized protein
LLILQNNSCYMGKRTLVLGVSTRPGKRSYNMVRKLAAKGHDVIAVGYTDGMIEEITVLTGQPFVKDVHTVIPYLRPEKQAQYYSYILELKPRRIIFNAKTENEELRKLARENNIETINACSLVMIGMDEY